MHQGSKAGRIHPQSIFRRITSLTAIICTATWVTCFPGTLHASTVLGAGDSVSWRFHFAYDASFEINSPNQDHGVSINLGYVRIPQAGTLEYRLDFFENDASTDPVWTENAVHLTGIVDQTGMPLIWLPLFFAPDGTWSDLDGVLKVTILSGQLRDLSAMAELTKPGTTGLLDVYQGVIVPEPGALSILALGALLIVRNGFRSRAS